MKTKTTLRPAIICALLFSLIFAASGQNPFDDDEANFYTGISPYILPKDGIEVNFLNSMTSFWVASREYFPATNSTRIANRYRFTRSQHLLRLNYGFSQSGRWDLGTELHYTRSRLDDEARSSPFRVYGGDKPSGDTFQGITLLGLRLRMMPFENVPELTAQLTAHFPISQQDETAKQQLGAQRPQLGLLTTFYQQVGESMYYFLQAGWTAHLANDQFDRTTHTPSVSGFLLFDTGGQAFYVFPGLTYAPTMQALRNGGLGRINQQLLGSLGALYQPGSSLGVMVNWNVPFILETESLSTEWVRESYTGVTVGVRLVL